MTVETTLYVDEPIIQVTVTGQIDKEQAQEMQDEVAAACDKIGACFIILDLLQVQGTLQESLATLLSDVSFGPDGEVYIAILSNTADEEVAYPVFPDLNTALDYVRQEIAKYAAQGGES